MIFVRCIDSKCTDQSDVLCTHSQRTQAISKSSHNTENAKFVLHTYSISSYYYRSAGDRRLVMDRKRPWDRRLQPSGARCCQARTVRGRETHFPFPFRPIHPSNHLVFRVPFLLFQNIKRRALEENHSFLQRTQTPPDLVAKCLRHQKHLADATMLPISSKR